MRVSEKLYFVVDRATSLKLIGHQTLLLINVVNDARAIIGHEKIINTET